jgi:hypothetical protein
MRDTQKWSNVYFAGLGLFSLERARERIATSLRTGAKCQQESRMRENRLSGLVGGAGSNVPVPTPILLLYRLAGVVLAP